MFVEQIEHFASAMRSTNAFENNRKSQSLKWMQRHIEEGLMQILHENTMASEKLKTLQQDVAKGKISPLDAADLVLEIFKERR